MVRVRSKSSDADFSQPLGRRGLLSILAASSVVVGLILDRARKVKTALFQEDPYVKQATIPFAPDQRSQHSIVCGVRGQFLHNNTSTSSGKRPAVTTPASRDHNAPSTNTPGVVDLGRTEATGSVVPAPYGYLVALAIISAILAGCESDRSHYLSQPIRPVVEDKVHFFAAWQSAQDGQLYESNAGPGRWVIVPHGTLFFVGSPKTPQSK